MRSFAAIAVVAASLFSGVFAQNQTTAGVTHTILVGANNTLTFSPTNITAAIGDIVNFVFMSKNHTFSQSNFTDPCTQFINTSISDPANQALTSGFQPVPVNATSFPVFSIQVTQSTPLWFYCQQTGHCSKGMVGAINANPDSANSFAAYQAKAMLTGTGGVTTSVLPSGSSPTGTAGTGTAASPTGSNTATTSPSPNAAVSLKASGMTGVATIGLGLVGVAMGMML